MCHWPECGADLVPIWLGSESVIWTTPDSRGGEVSCAAEVGVALDIGCVHWSDFVWMVSSAGTDTFEV